MRTIEEIRRTNLARLTSEGWSQAKIARAIGKDPRQVNQWFGKGTVRAMSSDIARELEQAVGKPRGWLDNVHDATESEPLNRTEISATPDPEVLHEAFTLLVHDQQHAGDYTPRAMTRRLVELYQRVATDGGRLSDAHNEEFVREIEQRRITRGTSSGLQETPEPHRGHRSSTKRAS